jgi:hypothetical protein
MIMSALTILATYREKQVYFLPYNVTKFVEQRLSTEANNFSDCQEIYVPEAALASRSL